MALHPAQHRTSEEPVAGTERTRIVEDETTADPGFPEALSNRLMAAGAVRPGQRVLDLSSGRSSIGELLSARGCHVAQASSDRSETQPGSVDVVVAGQCWQRLERGRASADALRALVPGGRLVIAQQTWIPLPGNMAEVAERMLSLYGRSATSGDGSGLHPSWLREVVVAGFRDLETFSFDSTVTSSHETWRARIRARATATGALSEKDLPAFDRDLRRLLEAKFADPIEVPHRVWVVVAGSPRAASL